MGGPVIPVAIATPPPEQPQVPSVLQKLQMQASQHAAQQQAQVQQEQLRQAQQLQARMVQAQILAQPVPASSALNSPMGSMGVDMN